MTTIDLYKADLKVYGYKNIPRFYRSKSFHERIDGLLMLICRQCPYLTILVRFLAALHAPCGYSFCVCDFEFLFTFCVSGEQ